MTLSLPQLIFSSNLHPLKRLILVVLARRDGEVVPYSLLCHETGLSRSAAKRHLGELREAGIVKAEAICDGAPLSYVIDEAKLS